MHLRSRLSLLPLAAALLLSPAAQAASPHIFQHPALSRDLIAFGYADDLWTVPREGGRATRLTTGVGIEFAPLFSPDGKTIAFTADYDGNTDVYTIPATGGIPHRVTYHPAPDVAVAWTPDGKSILFRTTRDSASRYTRLFTVPATGGLATPLPLPMAYQGELSPDASRIAYSPLPQAFGFDYVSYVSWGHYRGGRAGTINITTLPGLATTQVPHETAADFSPTWLSGKLYFLSGRSGPITLFSYDPGSNTVTEVVHPASKEASELRSVSSGPDGLVYDQLGEIYLFNPASGKPRQIPIDIAADLPEVRARLESVTSQVENIGISPSGLRAVVEAHGEILTVPAKHGPTRNLTNTPGAAEREPSWSPDGQSIAFFSDEPSPQNKANLYQLHIVGQNGAGHARVFPLAPEPAYYFTPVWSPDSKRIAFHDNHNRLFLLDIPSGKLTTVDDANTFGGFSSGSFDVAWSPDSHWLAYPHSTPNHLHALFLYSVDTGKSTQFTSQMADSRNPAFDRNGKYLYFTASTNYGATSDGLDMTSDLYNVTRNIYAVVLASDQLSPVAPESDDEKTPAEIKEKAKENADSTPAGEAAKAKAEAEKSGTEAKAVAPTPPKPTRVDLPGIESRIVAMPLPAAVYTTLAAGKPGTLYYLTNTESNRFAERDIATLSRFVLETRKTEKLAERVASFNLSADGEKMLLKLGPPEREPGSEPPPPSESHAKYVIVPANAPVKPGEGDLSFADMQVRVDPSAEWNQMYREVWRIERAYFYDANFHGVDTVAEEKHLAPYAAAIASRADLNYIFQEMLTGFSVGHLRGTGGNIPEAKHVPGGLLAADYVIRNNRYCIEKIYTGGDFNPQEKAPLSQPGLNVATGDCILAINGEDLTAATDIQQPLEGTAGHAITLHITSATGATARDITVVPIKSEYALRNIAWIDANQRKVDQLSGGKLAYVYLPDTAEGGFTNFNRYYMAQLNKKGAVIDERFNGGGQIADYIIEVMKRQPEAFWAPRYGTIEHTPNAAIYGPKAMIINEFAGSGGDAMPWLFRFNHIGPLVGKRTWGGLVGIGNIPVLMDGGHVTSPSVAFFSPSGQWDVENHGVEPDITVDQDPKAVAEGHDPQLEKAVSVVLEELVKHPPTEPTRPPYPNYHQP